MAILPPLIKEKFENLVDKSNEQFNNGLHKESVLLLEETWNLIPKPKVIYFEEGYHLVADMVGAYFVMNDFEKAKE